MPNAKKDVLVVDDNPLLLDVISATLTEQGCTVRTASDGFVALALIRDCEPDVLLSDLNMDGMSGFELLSIVRRRFPRMAAIAMSGAYSGEDVPPGVAADAFYAKGNSGVARLVDLVSGIEVERSRISTRSATPIWIPSVLACSAGFQTLLISCPECLRAFSHHAAEVLHEEQDACCPHCAHPMRLALVRKTRGADEILPYGWTEPNRVQDRFVHNRLALGLPVAKTQQQ